MARFQQLAAGIRAPVLRFIPGEHDASLDRGQAFEERFGPTRWSFDHKGVHFVALDNVSDPEGAVGEAQRDWLHKDLKAVSAELPVVVFTHRPLFDLYPQWDWATKDGAQVVEVLSQRRNLTVFYGHIHQENHHLTGHIAHHAARSLIFPLPPPGSQPKRAPVPWDPQMPGRGLGFRGITERDGVASVEEIPLSAQERVATARSEVAR